ncbi:MAG TPA: hypothetical protein PKE03_11035 [Bacteroidales bacterium]|nr:hypothetical protein [Bacteroidales bacterium]
MRVNISGIEVIDTCIEGDVHQSLTFIIAKGAYHTPLATATETHGTHT